MRPDRTPALHAPSPNAHTVGGAVGIGGGLPAQSLPLATKGPARERCQWQIQRPQRSGRRPDGGDQSWRGLGAYNPSVSLREPAPFTQGSLPSQTSGLTAAGGVRWLRQLATDAQCAPLRRSAGMRWELGACSGGHTGRPYGAPSIRFVGRGAHTPPDQAAGIAGLAGIAAAADPLVGAGFMPARAAPPGATGPRSSRPGHGGMWACRPTAFGEVRQKPEGVLGRI